MIDAPVARCRPTRALIDLAALRHNVGVARRHARGRRLCAVVKANAYGHGLGEVAPALQAAGVEAFGVAFVDEAVALRALGITRPIWVWGSTLTGCFDAIVKHQLVPVLGNLAQADALVAACRSRGLRLRVHLELDTGMARLGFGDAALEALLAAMPQWQPHLQVDGLMSHLAVADLPEDPFTEQQGAAFAALCGRLHSHGLAPTTLHLANSAGTCRAAVVGPRTPQAFVRCGLLLYGMQPLRGHHTADLRPVLALHSAVVALRDLPPGSPVSYGCTYRTPAGGPTRIATVPMGYADGYRRDFSGRAAMLLHGARVPVVGTVCMDMCMLDVTSLKNVELGDPVVLLGSQGNQTLAAEELADWAHTISWEIVCGIAARVARQAVDGAA